MSYENQDRYERVPLYTKRPPKKDHSNGAYLGEPSKFEVRLKTGEVFEVLAHYHFPNGPDHRHSPNQHVFRTYPDNYKREHESHATFFERDSVAYVRRLT